MVQNVCPKAGRNKEKNACMNRPPDPQTPPGALQEIIPRCCDFFKQLAEIDPHFHYSSSVRCAGKVQGFAAPGKTLGQREQVSNRKACPNSIYP